MNANSDIPETLPTDFESLSSVLPLHPIRNEDSYNRAVGLADRLALLDDPASDQSDYFESLSLLIEAYEDENYEIEDADRDPLDNLKYLLERNGMSGSDLGRLLGQRQLGALVLRGERQLSKSHIVTLCKRFKVGPELFLPLPEAVVRKPSGRRDDERMRLFKRKPHTKPVGTPETVLQVAARLIRNAAHAEDHLTNLRLQKLLYYVQGWSLVLLGRPMFSDAIEAWQHGPAVPSAWRRFRGKGKNVLSPSDAPPDRLDDNNRAFIDEVWLYYKKYSASALWKMTHSEDPWTRARGTTASDQPSGEEITRDSMRRFFGKMLTEMAGT